MALASGQTPVQVVLTQNVSYGSSFQAHFTDFVGLAHRFDASKDKSLSPQPPTDSASKGLEDEDRDNADDIRRRRSSTPGNSEHQDDKDRRASPNLIDIEQLGKAWDEVDQFEPPRDNVSILDSEDEEQSRVSSEQKSSDRGQHVVDTWRTQYTRALAASEQDAASSYAMTGYARTRKAHSNDDSRSFGEQVLTLRAQLAKLQSESSGPATWTDPWPTLYRVSCPKTLKTETYMTSPTAAMNKDGRAEHMHLQADRQLFDEALWMKQHSEMPFVVYKDYECYVKAAGTVAPSVLSYDDETGEIQERDALRATSETVKLRSRGLRTMLESLFQHTAGLRAYSRKKVFDGKTLKAPYIFFFHFEPEVQSFVNGCGRHQAAMKMLVQYMRKQSAQEASRARALFEAGRVTHDWLPYLFIPGQLVVRTEGNEPLVLEQTSPLFTPLPESAFKRGWECEAASIAFDGDFRRKEEAFNISVPADDRDAIITSLPIYPLRYGASILQKSLLQRGEIFFKCHERQYVTRPADRDAGEIGEDRYMVDVRAYYSVHGKSKNSKASGKKIEKPNPNDQNFLMQLPAEILGFRMSDKRWMKLSVLDLEPVQWNTKAFGNLVIEERSKELVEALVKNKIESDQGIDFVDGKGTGLILLLHGGPGTGKTFTAESVADLAKMPLYRVTCGDIGTSPARVEEYLRSVFYLGQRWQCIVLLDEADVFLEERSLDNLERNALVTVFLRALGYYNGILILTSNRVGCFDSAFRSRVQLALPYHPLNLEQRLKIWHNFIERLELVKEDMRLDEIKTHINKLAAFQMNGRQIRNVINSARQLARFRKTPLALDHVMHVIDISKGFDKYIEEVRGLDDEQFARENFVR
ncbi:hypothetical protein TI39_contig523g00006 [Zymoseptoria brevis]|uniref:AAA+ ATPase domain-containing protein n=1 Tax=Zymoseptoria brevis TaxID=1047168 RepID=A0A0F4GIL1_9PEZI|nr:hypothetical protein TI39_contig523g00006 [Zymoseptoria brevis]